MLGFHGVAVIEGVGARSVVVVDCQQAEHEKLSARGLVADVNEASMGHRTAQIWLWR